MHAWVTPLHCGGGPPLGTSVGPEAAPLQTPLTIDARTACPLALARRRWAALNRTMGRDDSQQPPAFPVDLTLMPQVCAVSVTVLPHECVPLTAGLGHALRLQVCAVSVTVLPHECVPLTAG